MLDICGIEPLWTPSSFIEHTTAAIAAQVGEGQVVMALSGGVDSTVAAALIHKAIGDKLHCIFVDNGLLRKGEFEQVMEGYRHFGFNIKGVAAKERFYTALADIADPEDDMDLG